MNLYAKLVTNTTTMDLGDPDIVSNYMVRLSFSSSDAVDYEALHEIMEKKGFSRTVLNKNAEKFKNVEATYLIARPKDYPVDGVFAEAAQIVSAFKRDHKLGGVQIRLMVLRVVEGMFKDLELAN